MKKKDGDAPKQYNTLIISGAGSADKKEAKEALIQLLVDATNRDMRDAVFKLLKEEASATDLLVDTIKDPRYAQHKGKLIAACWESEKDCSPHLSLFVDLALNEDYSIALEAITVIDNMEGPIEKEALASSLKKLESAKKKSSPDKSGLLDMLGEILGRH